jgi:hypothetical protein
MKDYRQAWRRLAVTGGISAAAVVLCSVYPARSQSSRGASAPDKPATGPHASRHSGGFTHPEPVDFADHEGWTSLWDGQTLNGWSGDSNWKVENGAMVIEPTCEKPTGTVYLVWQGGEVSDFELKLEMKGEGAINSGIQYRSWIVPPDQGPGGAPRANRNSTPCPSGNPRGTPPSRASEAQWNLAGPQYDFDAGNRYTGQFYEQATGRGIIAWRGDVVHTGDGHKPRLIATLGSSNDLGKYYKANDWNQLHIVARGHQSTHILNGRVVAMLFDDDKSKFHGSGKIGLEVESTGKIYVRNIWLKKL